MSIVTALLASVIGGIVGAGFVLFIQQLGRAEDDEIEGEMERRQRP
jgi:hypothetical protein